MSRSIFFALTLASPLAAAESVGLLGGQVEEYIGQVAPDSSVTTLHSSAGGSIYSVAINTSSLGLAGGQHDGVPIAFRLSANGNVSPLSGTLPLTGSIESVAINTSGVGLIGGYDTTANRAYAARVSPEGALSLLSGATLPIDVNLYSVAINHGGLGLIGGHSAGGNGYAAQVSAEGVVTPLTGDIETGAIITVAINNVGYGLIGGLRFDGLSPTYAAQVTPAGEVIQLTGGNLPISGDILSVAINGSGRGLIGGYNANTSTAYLARVDLDRTVTEITGILGNRQIRTVAINNSGMGLIGGRGNEGIDNLLYVAQVSPDGVLTELTGGGLVVNGEILSVAINEAGIGLIGGAINGNPYAAIVSPNGTVTQLTVLEEAQRIWSVALRSDAEAADSLTPASIGPYGAPVTAQLAAGYALYGHMGNHRPSLKETGALTAYSSRRIVLKPTCEKKPYAVWLEPFGNFVYQSKNKDLPDTSNQIGGVLAAFEALYNSWLVGGGLGYAHDSIHYGNHLGHATLQEETVFLYASYVKEHLYVNGALWGGLYQCNNTRRTLNFISSKGNFHGWLFDPHVEVATPFRFAGWFTLEPFLMVDWVNNWQGGYKEKGSSGLNLVVPSDYSSLLRTEVGLRFFETCKLSWGRFVLEEKLSYVNQAPFHVDRSEVFFVASPSTFSVAVGNSQTENLAGVSLKGSFLPCNPKYPYGRIEFQGEFSSTYQSYFVGLEIGKAF